MLKVIYEPQGRAAEYASLALNLYRGCSHACLYCYAPMMLHIPREDFYFPAFIRPRPNILESLEIQAKAMAGEPRPILLSFTSDPYQELDKTLAITRQAIEILAAHNLTATILTKSGSWGLVRDLDVLRKNPMNSWAVTLTHRDIGKSIEWEPLAALPQERIESLRIAHDEGLHTWVSFEPVLDPEAVYWLLEETRSFVDFYKVGKLNYHPLAKSIDWRRFKEKIEQQLQRLGKPYRLKKELLEAAA